MMVVVSLQQEVTLAVGNVVQVQMALLLVFVIGLLVTSPEGTSGIVAAVLLVFFLVSAKILQDFLYKSQYKLLTSILKIHGIKINLKMLRIIDIMCSNESIMAYKYTNTKK